MHASRISGTPFTITCWIGELGVSHLHLHLHQSHERFEVTRSQQSQQRTPPLTPLTPRDFNVSSPHAAPQPAAAALAGYTRVADLGDAVDDHVLDADRGPHRIHEGRAVADGGGVEDGEVGE